MTHIGLEPTTLVCSTPHLNQTVFNGPGQWPCQISLDVCRLNNLALRHSADDVLYQGVGDEGISSSHAQCLTACSPLLQAMVRLSKVTMTFNPGFWTYPQVLSEASAAALFNCEFGAQGLDLSTGVERSDCRCVVQPPV